MIRKAFHKIFNSEDGKFVFLFLLVSASGIFLYMTRPQIKSHKDVVEVNGTLNSIEQVLVYHKRINKTESDSTYHFHLNEYPSKFHVSYYPYDGKGFYKTAHKNDSIILHIAPQHEKYLHIPNKKIRSFSLSVNDKSYITVDQGYVGFGKGYFELIMFFFPLALASILIYKILKQ